MDINTWLLIGLNLLFIVAIVLGGRRDDRIERLERWLDALVKHSGINRAELADREVLALLQENKKGEAIRAYRLFMGANLAGAKAHVEWLQQTARPSA
jgi:hypothetical protein